MSTKCTYIHLLQFKIKVRFKNMNAGTSELNQKKNSRISNITLASFDFLVRIPYFNCQNLIDLESTPLD